MALEKKTNHNEEAKANLVSQFQGKANIAKLLDSYVSRVQELETVYFDLLEGRLSLTTLASGTSTSVGPGFLEDSSGAFTPGALERGFLEDNSNLLHRIVSNTTKRINIETNATPSSGTYSVGKSSGVQLDNIGTLLSSDREGRNDDGYRSALANKIRGLTSFGTIENIISVIRASDGYNGTGAIQVREDPALKALVAIGPGGMGWSTEINFEKAFALLKATRPAGVAMRIFYQTGSGPHFVTETGVGLGFDQGEFVGVTEG